jgi:putative transposase
VRFGYRRLTVLLRREGWRVNAKRIYRLMGWKDSRCAPKPRKKLASRVRIPLLAAARPYERWSVDFVGARLAVGRWFRTLTVVDLSRASLTLVADRSLTGGKSPQPSAACCSIGRQAITVDNGGEFVSRAMDSWAYAHEVRLDSPGAVRAVRTTRNVKRISVFRNRPMRDFWNGAEPR